MQKIKKIKILIKYTWQKYFHSLKFSGVLGVCESWYWSTHLSVNILWSLRAYELAMIKISPLDRDHTEDRYGRRMEVCGNARYNHKVGIPRIKILSYLCVCVCLSLPQRMCAKVFIYIYIYIYILCVCIYIFDLIGFFGISTLVGYLMPNPLYNSK